MRLDPTILAQLIDEQAGSLQLWLRSRCHSAEDVVQEAFGRLAVVDPAPENPVAWLYRVCRNIAESERLSDQRRQSREQHGRQIQVVSTDAADSLELEETLCAIEGLDDDLRQVIVARIWGGLSLDEIGKICGISAATAFRRYEAALQALRAKLDAKCETRP